MDFNHFALSYVQKGLLKEQAKSFKAFEQLLKRAIKELTIAERNLEIDEGVAFTVAYTAMLHAGRALVLSKGFRPTDRSQHRTVVEACGCILGAHYKKLIAHYDVMRKKRNIFTYEADIDISQIEAQNALRSAKDLVMLIIDYVRRDNPQQEFNFKL